MRKFAVINLIVALMLILSACATSAPPTPEVQEPTQAPAAEATATQKPAAEATATTAAEPTATLPPAAKYNESPMLAELVKAGKLPPVEDRLPENPMVVTPLVEVGKYSEELKFGFVGANAAWGGFLYLAGWEHPVSWSPDFSTIVPNILESWETSPDATEYTWHIRKGLKWSDGEPYTADDIIFYLEDVIGNTDLFPGGIGADWLPSTEVAKGLKWEKLDDYTVKFIFPKPYGTFMIQLATWGGRQFTQYPKHYLMQFHKKYNPDVDELVAADGNVKDWIGLFFKKGPDTWGDPQRFFDDPNLPSMSPWVTKQPLGTGTTIILERNPYYWKVDTEGNQLPYIDKVTGISYQDDQSRTFAMLNGDLDYIKDPGEPSRELYYGAVDEGKPIAIYNPQPDGGNTQSIHFNMTVKDPILNEVFNNKDFRIGMSHAIDRAEIIEVVFKGQGKPAQVAPLESSPLYNEQLANQYLEYDVDLANEYLDKVLPNKDAEGFRLDKNGRRFNFLLTFSNDLSFGTHYVQVAELLIKYWKAVGVDVTMDSITDAVLGERRKTNDIQAYLYHGGEGGAGITAILDPRWHVPGEFHGYFGTGWYLWRVDSEKKDPNAVEMPPEVKAVRDIYDQAIQQPTLEGQIEKMKELMQASADMFWCIGISRPGIGYQPASSRLGNIPETWMDGWLEGTLKIIYPEQWYIKE